MTHGISHGPSVTECARCCGSSSYALTSAYRVTGSRGFSYAWWSLPVTWQKWLSHHSIRHGRKTYAERIFMALCFIELLHCRHFYLSCSCDLYLDPMTFIYELDPYSLEIPDIRKWTSHVKSFESYCIAEYVHTDRQTLVKLYTSTPLGGWSTRK